MLKFPSPDALAYFREVRKFAKEVGKWEDLRGKLAWLAQYQGCVTEVWKDFAPYSFAFVVKRASDMSFKFNGGLIFHGAHDRGGDGGAPTFSVCLEPCDGWQIHT